MEKREVSATIFKNLFMNWDYELDLLILFTQNPHNTITISKEEAIELVNFVNEIINKNDNATEI